MFMLCRLGIGGSYWRVEVEKQPEPLNPALTIRHSCMVEGSSRGTT